MQYAAIKFKERMDRDGINYSYKGEISKGVDAFTIPNTGDHMMQEIFVFITETEILTSMRVASVPLYCQGTLLSEINKIHREYRWVRIYIDDENWLRVQYDAMFTDSSIGDICFNAIVKLSGVTDECYKRLMKHII